jgi:hypothetical protein
LVNDNVSGREFLYPRPAVPVRNRQDLPDEKGIHMSRGKLWFGVLLFSLAGCLGRPVNYGAQTYAQPQYVTAPDSAPGPVASPGLSPTPISYPQFQPAAGPVATPVYSPQTSSTVIVTPTVTASSYYAPGAPQWQTAMINAPGTYIAPAPRYVDMAGTLDGRPPRWHWMGRRYGAW